MGPTLTGRLPLGDNSLRDDLLWRRQRQAGTIFKFDPKTNHSTVLYSFGASTNDGASLGSLTLSGTNLYGMTCREAPTA